MSKLEAGNPLCEGGPLGIHGTSCKFTYIKTIKNQPNKCIGKYILATGFHDSTHLQNITQFGSFLQVGVKIKKYLKPPPTSIYTIHGWNGYFWRAWSKVHDFPFSALCTFQHPTRRNAVGPPLSWPVGCSWKGTICREETVKLLQ